MRWSSRLLVRGLLIGILGVLVAPAFAVPDDEGSSLSYFDDDDDTPLWVVPNMIPALVSEAGSFLVLFSSIAAVGLLTPSARSLVVDSPVLLRSPPRA
jgi:hypothetical protein